MSSSHDLMDFQPKPEPEPGSPPTPNPASSTSHGSFIDMCISELVSDLRANCDKVEEVFAAKDAKNKAEIGSLSVKYELERLQRLHIEDELKKKQQEYLNLERKWLDDRNAVAALRIRCCELEEQNKKNLETIQKLMDENCRLGKEKCNADARLLSETVVLDSSPLKRKKVVGHCIGESSELCILSSKIGSTLSCLKGYKHLVFELSTHHDMTNAAIDVLSAILEQLLRF
ncbi:hypothetical protein PIB30_070121 [Stylosanthes scabra]|uniref:Uncharacterized protein n=1 Tax=Stylosanthes scabra TaxID=79078 RepID=A0ABU6SPH0_9FABA|nr:hypothetical protein [Stylosanthes scabra]